MMTMVWGQQEKKLFFSPFAIISGGKEQACPCKGAQCRLCTDRRQLSCRYITRMRFSSFIPCTVQQRLLAAKREIAINRPSIKRNSSLFFFFVLLAPLLEQKGRWKFIVAFIGVVDFETLFPSSPFCVLIECYSLSFPRDMKPNKSIKL